VNPALAVAIVAGLVSLVTAWFTHRDASVANQQTRELQYSQQLQEATRLAIETYTGIIRTQQLSLDDLSTLLQETREAASNETGELRSKLSEAVRVVESLKRRNEQLLEYIESLGHEPPKEGREYDQITFT
jgi:chromosome segregation ATPase